MDRAVVFVNRSAGGSGDLDRLASALTAAGIDHELHDVDGDDVESRAKQAAAAGASMIVAAGGDGTVSSIAAAIAGTPVRLGILPLGTLNHFARDLGIPTDLDKAAAVLAEGRERQVDVAELNGRLFVNNSAIGLYPLMVMDREAQRRRLGRSKRLALLVASVRTLARFGRQRLTLTADARAARLDTPLLFVGNNDYRLGLPEAGGRDRLDSGRLCVLVMRRKSRLGFLAASLRALAGMERSDDMVRLDGVQSLRVDCARTSLPVSVDGEITRMRPPLNYRIRPGALRVVVP